MANDKKIEPIFIIGANIKFRNFAGKEKKFNAAGKRNFVIFLDPKLAADMKIQGWNIKETKKSDEYEDVASYIPVEVSYNQYPPTIYMVTENGRTKMLEEEIEMLDWAEIVTADVKLSPYQWEVNGKSGIKAYLSTLSVIIKEDPIERAYKDRMEEMNQSELVGEDGEDDEESVF